MDAVYRNQKYIYDATRKYYLFGRDGLIRNLEAAPGMQGASIGFLGNRFDLMTVLCLLLFIGAMGKSAQLGLHTWLPDAMEGPTPVSALIHAATMVTAGVFMVARLSPLFETSDFAMTVVLVIGATNRRELIDDAVLSRFTVSIELPAPDAAARERILQAEFGKAQLALPVTEALVRETSGMSGRRQKGLRIITSTTPGVQTEKTGTPDWSPDGTWLVYANNHTLWRIDADGSNVQRLTKSSAIDTESKASWSWSSSSSWWVWRPSIASSTARLRPSSSFQSMVGSRWISGVNLPVDGGRTRSL